eukprot:2950713-Prymnesium_polylepis.1
MHGVRASDGQLSPTGEVGIDIVSVTRTPKRGAAVRRGRFGHRVGLDWAAAGNRCDGADGLRTADARCADGRAGAGWNCAGGDSLTRHTGSSARGRPS